MNKKVLYAEPKKLFRTRRNKVLGIIFIFMTSIIAIYYFLGKLHIIPAEDFYIILLFSLGEIPFMFILLYDYIFAKRLIIYEDGLYIRNRKKFISFGEINYIKIDSVFLNTVYLKVNFSDNKDEIFPLNYNDLNKIRKIFAISGVHEKKPQIIRRWSMNRRVSTN